MPITRTGPLRVRGSASSERPTWHLRAGDLAQPAAGLQHQLRIELDEVGEEQQVGLVAGRDGAVLAQPVPERRVQRREDERILDRDPRGDRAAHHRVDVSLGGHVLRLAVVGAERHPRRAELLDERQQRVEVARARRLADQQPHPGAQPLPALLRRDRLVVGADARGRVGLQGLPEHARRVPVDVRRAAQRQLRELGLGAADHAGEVHHLGEADHAPAPEQPLEVAGAERAPRRLEARRRHGRRGHEVDVERQLRADVEQPVDAVGAEHVRDLVRVGHAGRRPEREHEARELVRQQLGRLEVQVRVDEPGDDPAAARVDRLRALVRAETRDEAVGDRDVDVEPLPREDREDPPAADDEIGRLVSPRHRDPPGEQGCHRWRAYYCYAPWRF
jgi:hypothetical protein